MSQQEFFRSSQSSQADESGDAEISIQRPRSWSNQEKTGDVTKSEHPSAYEEELPPYTYPAQDRLSTSQKSGESRSSFATKSEAPQREQRRFSPDGDAVESGYRPYQAPPWARQQTRNKRHILSWVILVLLIILLVKLIPLLAAVVLALLGIGLFLVLLPILIVLAFVVILGGLVLFLLSRMGIPVWRSLLHTRRWNNNWRRW